MDLDYLLALQGWREGMGGALDGVFAFISELGMPTIALVLTAVLYWCVSKQTGRYMLLTFNLSCLVNSLLKTIFAVYRPWVRSDKIKPVPAALSGATGYSFPSGHTANAVGIYGALGVKEGKKHKWLFWVMAVIVLLIGFSRNYLGVHTPQDVIVSMVAGVLILWGASRLTAWEQAKAGRDRWVLLGGVLACAGLLVLVLLRRFPIDYDASGNVLVDPAKMAKDTFATVGAALGFFTGWFWEKRRIDFAIDGQWWLRVVRAVIGVGGMLLINSVLGKLLASLLGANVGGLVASFLVIFFVTALYPWLFTLVQRMMKNRHADHAADA